MSRRGRRVWRHPLGRRPGPRATVPDSFPAALSRRPLNGPPRRWPPPSRPDPPGTPEPRVALPRGWGTLLTHRAAWDSLLSAFRLAYNFPGPSMD